MNINIIAVGSIKESFYTQAVAEYLKRLSRYCRINIIELKDEKTPDRASDLTVEKIKKTEGGRILDKLVPKEYMIALAIEGKSYDSVELSEKLAALEITGRGSLTFVIGGSLGLSKEVLERADMKLSFSKLTFPHQLMRVILLEQIYRSYRIRNNEPYHK